jgi:malonyl CoA-acyl carrier protein transacylase
MLAASCRDREVWSEKLDDVLVAYNSTQHRVTQYAPAVVLYSWLCKDIIEVPATYRELLKKALSSYRDWTSMKLDIQNTVKVTPHIISSYITIVQRLI